MECQILFTGKNKKNIINLSSAENAHRVVKFNMCKQALPVKQPNFVAINIYCFLQYFSWPELILQIKEQSQCFYIYC